MNATQTRYTYAEWQAEARRRFGEPPEWRFVCPSCGHVARVKDWRAAGASQGAVAIECVGRALGSTKEIGDPTGGPCNYAGYGLFHLNPVTIEMEDGETVQAFDFAPE